MNDLHVGFQDAFLLEIQSQRQVAWSASLVIEHSRDFDGSARNKPPFLTAVQKHTSFLLN